MSLGERLREMLDPGATPGGRAGPPLVRAVLTRRRPRTQAQPVNPMRSYDASEPARPMPRAQWIGLGLAAALAVALTAGLVFAILTITRPRAQLATPTPRRSPSRRPPAVDRSANIFALPPHAASPVSRRRPTLRATGRRVSGSRSRTLAATAPTCAAIPARLARRSRRSPMGRWSRSSGQDQSVDGTTWRNVRDRPGGYRLGRGRLPGCRRVGADHRQPRQRRSLGISIDAVPRQQRLPRRGCTAAPRRRCAAHGHARSGRQHQRPGREHPLGAGQRRQGAEDARPRAPTSRCSGLSKEVDGQVWRQVRDSSGVTGWIIRGAVAPSGSVATPAPAAPRAPAATTPARSGSDAAHQRRPPPTDVRASAPRPRRPQPAAGPTPLERRPPRCPDATPKRPADHHPGGDAPPVWWRCRHTSERRHP